MPDAGRYFDLPLADQAELLHGLAPILGRRAEILEKDIWLCQVLGTLFTLPCRKPMAFKGGTSLSKVSWRFARQNWAIYQAWFGSRVTSCAKGKPLSTYVLRGFVRSLGRAQRNPSRRGIRE